MQKVLPRGRKQRASCQPQEEVGQRHPVRHPVATVTDIIIDSDRAKLVIEAEGKGWLLPPGSWWLLASLAPLLAILVRPSLLAAAGPLLAALGPLLGPFWAARGSKKGSFGRSWAALGSQRRLSTKPLKTCFFCEIY